MSVNFLQAAEFIDVPDLYHFLAKEISKTTFDADIIEIDVEDGGNEESRHQRDVRNIKQDFNSSNMLIDNFS